MPFIGIWISNENNQGLDDSMTLDAGAESPQGNRRHHPCWLW